jgi:hypothetical protein
MTPWTQHYLLSLFIQVSIFIVLSAFARDFCSNTWVC